MLQNKPNQPNPKPRLRPRRAAAPQAGPAATTKAKKHRIIASGPAYFTFTDSGEITITSYELAHALRTANPKMGKNARLKVGVQIGKFGGTAGMYTDTNPPTQGNSMCLCDVNC